MIENSKLKLEEIKIRLLGLNPDIFLFLFQYELLTLMASDVHEEDKVNIISNNYLLALSLLELGRKLPNLEPSLN